MINTENVHAEKINAKNEWYPSKEVFVIMINSSVSIPENLFQADGNSWTFQWSFQHLIIVYYSVNFTESALEFCRGINKSVGRGSVS